MENSTVAEARETANRFTGEAGELPLAKRVT